jgi:hypothetical protein
LYPSQMKAEPLEAAGPCLLQDNSSVRFHSKHIHPVIEFCLRLSVKVVCTPAIVTVFYGAYQEDVPLNYGFRHIYQV